MINSIYNNTVELPDNCELRKNYEGEPILVVPTVRTVIESTEIYTIEIMMFSQWEPANVTIHQRPLGDESDFSVYECSNYERKGC